MLKTGTSLKGELKRRTKRIKDKDAIRIFRNSMAKTVKAIESDEMELQLESFVRESSLSASLESPIAE